MDTDHIKYPKTEGPVMAPIAHRWSPRSYSDRAITAAEMHLILEAGTWAFSAFNEQPWRWGVAHKGTAAFERLWGLLMPGNQPWCRNAAALAVAAVQTTQAANGKPNPWAHHDLGAANYALSLQANALGIYNHVMAGFDKARAKTELNLPDDLEPLVMIAFGFLGEAEALPEPFLGREKTPRSRKPVADVTFEIPG